MLLFPPEVCTESTKETIKEAWSMSSFQHRMKADTQKQHKRRFKKEKSSNSPLRNFINNSTSSSGNIMQQQSGVKPTVS